MRRLYGLSNVQLWDPGMRRSNLPPMGSDAHHAHVPLELVLLPAEQRQKHCLLLFRGLCANPKLELGLVYSCMSEIHKTMMLIAIICNLAMVWPLIHPTYTDHRCKVELYSTPSI